MSSIAEQVFEAVKSLPEQQAAEVLDFAEFLQAKSSQNEEQMKMAELKAFFVPYQKDLTNFKFDREEANAR